jgi:hypothetical protein
MVILASQIQGKMQMPRTCICFFIQEHEARSSGSCHERIIISYSTAQKINESWDHYLHQEIFLNEQPGISHDGVMLLDPVAFVAI